MALGCAHLLGYRLAPNFDRPYQALNVSEFWRRWHMSLSTWLRDYLFIPLGGSRGGELVTARNLLVTMTLGGLWHGASWTFIVWGLFHGVLLAGHRVFRAWCAPRAGVTAALHTVPGTILRWALTMAAVSVGWVFFRAETFQTAATVLHRLVIPHTGRGTPIHGTPVILALVAVIIAHLLAQGGGIRWLQRLPAPVAGAVYGVGLSLTLLLAAPANQAFIYFQF
jgi:alginate O-acetyltransferase complex protein AlgI